MSYIGFNVNGDWHSQFYPVAKNVGGWHVVINNLPLAQSLANEGLNIINRFTSPLGYLDEGFNNWHKSIGAVQYAKILADAHGHNNKHIWMYVMNEPHGGSISEIRDLVNFSLATWHELRRMGFKVVGLNTPPAFYRSDWIEAGVWDSVISYAHDYSDVFKIAYHDYAPMSLVRYGNKDQIDFAMLSNSDYVKKENWSKVIVPETAWHLHHAYRLFLRAIKLGKNIKLCATEIAIGQMPDTNNLPAYLSLCDKYPSAPINRVENGKNFLDGYNTLHNYWRDVYPNVSPSQIMFDQLVHYADLASVYADFFCLYGFGWSEHYGSDFRGDFALHDMIRTHNQKLNNSHNSLVYMSSTGSLTNVRSSPRISNFPSNVIGTISQNKLVKLLDTANGWHRILFDNTQIGFVSANFIKITSKPIVLPDYQTVSLNYVYDKNNESQREIHNQIQLLLKSLGN
jgi:hypothetical protein